MSGMTSIAAEIKARAVEEALANVPVSGAPWGYVTSLDPIAVRLDGANLTPEGPVPNDPIYPDSIVSTLRIGDRVQVLLAGQRATVIGVAGGGDTGWQPLDLESGWTPGNQPPMWRTLGGEVQMRGAIVGPVTTSLQDVATGLPAPVSGAIPRFATIGQAGRIGGIEVSSSGILRFQSQNSPLPTWLGIDCVRYARA